MTKKGVEPRRERLVPINKEIRALWDESGFFSKHLAECHTPESIADKLNELFEEIMDLSSRKEYLRATYAFVKKFGKDYFKNNFLVLLTILRYDFDGSLMQEIMPILVQQAKKTMGITSVNKDIRDDNVSVVQKEATKMKIVDTKSPEFVLLKDLEKICKDLKINPQLLIFLSADVANRLMESLEDAYEFEEVNDKAVKAEKINLIVAVLLESVFDSISHKADFDVYLRFIMMLGRIPVDESGKLCYPFTTSEEVLDLYVEDANGLENNDPLSRHGANFSEAGENMLREEKNDFRNIHTKLKKIRFSNYIIYEDIMAKAEKIVSGKNY